MSIPADLKDQGHLSIVVWATVRTNAGDVTMNNRIIYLCTAGRQMKAPAYPYQPLIVQVEDIVTDVGEGSSRLAFTLAADRGVYCYKSGTSPYWEHFDNLQTLLQAYPSFSRAEVEIGVELHDCVSAGSSATSYTLWQGVVRKLSGVSPMSVTFECEQDVAVRDKIIPARTLDEVYDWHGHPESRQDPSAKGQPSLASFGSFLPDVEWASMSTWQKRNVLGVCGLDIPLANLAHCGVISQFVTAYGYELLHDNEIPISGSLESGTDWGVYLNTGGSKRARLYNKWEDLNGTTHNGQTMYRAAGTQVSAFLTPTYPWVQLPIVPSLPDGVDAYWYKAIDGNPNTYTIINPLTHAYYILPSVSLPGSLSMNSTDAGTGTYDHSGAGAPVGLKLVALLRRNPSAVNGVFELSLVTPGGALWGGLPYAATTFNIPYSGTTDWKLCQVNLPCDNGVTPGTAGSGWIGSHFHSGNFESSTEVDGPDGSLFWSQNKVEPMMIKVNNTSSAQVWLVALALVAGCRVNVEANPLITFLYSPEAEREAWADRESSRTRDARPYRVGISASGGREYLPRDDGRRDAWSNSVSRTQKKSQYDVKMPPTAFAASAATVKAPDSFITGTSGEVLRDPIHHMCFALSYMRGEEVAEGTEFGSYTEARTLLTRWWSGSAANPLHTWDMNEQAGKPSPLGTFIDAGCAPVMDLKVRRLRNGKWGFTIWGPWAMLSTSLTSVVYISGRPTVLIEPMEHVLAGDGGAAMSMSADTQSVRNLINIRYGQNLQYVARCYQTGASFATDNGVGEAWCAGSGGAMPYGSTNTPVDLAEWSYRMFGLSELFTIDVPFVDSPRVAAMIGAYYLARYYRPEVVLRFSANAGLLDMHPGHIFFMKNDLWSKLAWRYLLGGDYNADPSWDTVAWMVTQIDTIGGCGEPLTHEVSAILLPTQFGTELVSGNIIGGTSEDLLLASSGT